jgi:hypothetical protein
MTYPPYRQTFAKALILLFLLGAGFSCPSAISPPPAMAESDGFDTLPDEEFLPVPPSRQETASPGGNSGAKLPTVQEEPKRKWWQRLGGNKKKDMPIPEERVVNVGPREPAASPDPLLRLPVPVMVDGQRVEPGFYLIRQTAAPDGSASLELKREKRVIATLYAKPGEAAPAGPAKPMDERMPPARKASIRLSPDYARLSILFEAGETRWETRAYPTVMESRPELGY